MGRAARVGFILRCSTLLSSSYLILRPGLLQQQATTRSASWLYSGPVGRRDGVSQANEAARLSMNNAEDKAIDSRTHLEPVDDPSPPNRVLELHSMGAMTIEWSEKYHARRAAMLSREQPPTPFLLHRLSNRIVILPIRLMRILAFRRAREPGPPAGQTRRGLVPGPEGFP
ncbi:hypothetical protein B0J12DRAFT_258516 [Macrophomina phaseolina]|uniref:Uncharacterized protein n=1 Tax=Macrophomina phaseolina TaxID=35725 RepID=A0ABQ8FZK2_9PEZI|nr:hypothetical protein B0J12DRAFT_258516 [Macrophomina phaseolina]